MYELSSIYGRRWQPRQREFRSIEKDDNRALEYLEKCVKVWPADSIHWRLGIMYKYDFPDIIKAKEHFAEAVGMGHADSSHQLAEILEAEVPIFLGD